VADSLPTADQIFSAMSAALKTRDLEDFRDLLIVLAIVDAEAAEIIYNVTMSGSTAAEVTNARAALAAALTARASVEPS
jgi:hypothetical protein